MTTPSTALRAGFGSWGGAGAGLLRSYGKGLFTSVFCVSLLLLGQLSVCNSRVKLSGISTSNYVSI